ncbi:MAG TPA: RNA-binding S4 domain-containing protein [candidate division Zixibacteria bacterium]|nr:RNA-binding S4 domain-containing protein [candidate division Zixibacteria bacterium]
MRIDDYLSTVFLIKRRTVAKDWIQAGKVRLNGGRTKPGHDVNAGDLIEIYYKNHKLKVEVLEVPGKSIPKAQAENYYKPIEDLEV